MSIILKLSEQNSDEVSSSIKSHKIHLTYVYVQLNLRLSYLRAVENLMREIRSELNKWLYISNTRLLGTQQAMGIVRACI